MKIFIGADHRGFELKDFLRSWLSGLGYEVEDCGAKKLNKDDDYVDFAIKVAKSVVGCQMSEIGRGIVVCGSGVGVDIVANKIKGVRCGFGLSEEQVISARTDDDINVLALAADFVNLQDTKRMVTVFLKSKFLENERYLRRIRKIEKVERF